jgi:hypothetical protein
MSTNQTTAGEVMHRTNRRKFLAIWARPLVLERR